MYDGIPAKTQASWRKASSCMFYYAYTTTVDKCKHERYNISEWKYYTCYTYYNYILKLHL